MSYICSKCCGNYKIIYKVNDSCENRTTYQCFCANIITFDHITNKIYFAIGNKEYLLSCDNVNCVDETLLLDRNSSFEMEFEGLSELVIRNGVVYIDETINKVVSLCILI